MIRLVILSLVIGLSGVTWAASSDPRAAYLNRQYESAKNQYLHLIHAQPNNAGYHYNLGSTYYRLNDWVNAKRHYLYALSLRPTHPDIRYNIQLTNRQLIDQKLFFKDHFPHILGQSYATIHSIMLVLTPLFLIITFIMWPTRPVTIRRPLIVFHACWGILLITVTSLLYQTPHYGIVTTKKTAILSGPSATQPTLFYAHEGAEFKIIKSSNQWSLIQFGNGLKGWISHPHMVPIP